MNSKPDSVSKPVMRYHGAKFRLAPWVISFFPEHQTYVEPFGGSAGILMQKPRSYGEVYNDLDGQVVNLFRVLQDKVLAAELVHQCTITPFARKEFNLAYEDCDCPVENARRLLIRATMGFGSAGASKGSTGFRIDTRRSYGTASHLWAAYPDSIASFTSRLQGVLIENRPAIDVMKSQDGIGVLHYVDPPYVHSTRYIGASGYYRHELSNDDHEILIQNLLELEGFVIVSGYESDLYNDLLSGWEKHSTRARMSSNRGTGIKTECLWLSPSCSDRHGQIQLLGVE